MTLNLSLSEAAGSRSLHRRVGLSCALVRPACPVRRRAICKRIKNCPQPTHHLGVVCGANDGTEHRVAHFVGVPLQGYRPVVLSE